MKVIGYSFRGSNSDCHSCFPFYWGQPIKERIILSYKNKSGPFLEGFHFGGVQTGSHGQ